MNVLLWENPRDSAANLPLASLVQRVWEAQVLCLWWRHRTKSLPADHFRELKCLPQGIPLHLWGRVQTFRTWPWLSTMDAERASSCRPYSGRDGFHTQWTEVLQMQTHCLSVPIKKTFLLTAQVSPLCSLTPAAKGFSMNDLHGHLWHKEKLWWFQGDDILDNFSFWN